MMVTDTSRLTIIVNKPTSIAPLVIFRVLFGFMMFVSVARFAIKGWIHDLYIQPKFYFTFYGFEWVKPLGEIGMYITFLLMGLAALCIMLGLYYRTVTVLFFITFTYVELIDKTNYLNHYYFVSLVSFLMIFLPANRYFSLDSWRKPSLTIPQVPAWCVNILKVQLAIVYLYAGLAKLNTDWMLEALPLRIWLPSNESLPLIGGFMDELWVAYAFSWFGAFYDITIVFFLLWSKTRPAAYLTVVVFHLLTWVLFPIGMFPFIMILSTLIFFPSTFHERLINNFNQLFKLKKRSLVVENPLPLLHQKWLLYLMVIFITWQIITPWRYLFYPGNLFWTEEGFRFSWRVMLIEKSGHVTFHIRDKKTGREGEAYPGDYLTPVQEKMMSTQPDMILQFAHYLAEEYKKKGFEDLEVKAEAYVALNGRSSQLLIDPEVDLLSQCESFEPKKWILPLK